MALMRDVLSLGCPVICELHGSLRQPCCVSGVRMLRVSWQATRCCAHRRVADRCRRCPPPTVPFLGAGSPARAAQSAPALISWQDRARLCRACRAWKHAMLLAGSCTYFSRKNARLVLSRLCMRAVPLGSRTCSLRCLCLSRACAIDTCSEESGVYSFDCACCLVVPGLLEQ